MKDYIQLPLNETNYAKNIYWVYGIVLKNNVPFNAEAVMNKLRKYGIGTRPFFYPMHLQPVLMKMGLFNDESYPVSENISQRGLYMPSGMAISEEQIKRVSNALQEIIL